MRCKNFCWLLFGCFFGGVLTAEAQASNKPAASVATLLKASRWQKRVLLLCAPTATDAALLRQRQLLAPARSDLDARDLLVREAVFDNLSAADKKYVTETLRTSGASFTVLLIGKDGGAKRRETEPVTPGSLFKTIDVMPMRRQEMKKQ
jgi:hypothetical protein